MARQDMDIKADVIAELEDIDAPRGGLNVLDALMIEGVAVDKGAVLITVIHEDRSLSEDKAPLAADIREALEDIEDIAKVDFIHMTRSALRRSDPLASFGGESLVIPTLEEAPKAAPEAAEEAAPAALTLSALLSGVEEPEEEEEAPQKSVEIYSGGGCSLGTNEINYTSPTTEPEPAKTRAPEPAKPSAPVMPSLPAASAPAIAPAPAPMVRASAGVPGEVTLSMDEFLRFKTMELELQNRPTAQEFQELQNRYQLLRAKVEALQETFCTFFDDF